MEQIIGKKSEELSVEALHALANTYENVHIDLGTGDGLFAWRLAKKAPSTFVLGVDAARDSLAEGSARAAKKPARGGAPNARFLCMNVLEMKGEFEGLADTLSINFPWGSLLSASAIPDEMFVKDVRKCMKNKSKLDLFVNLHVFNDDEQRASLNLPELDEDYLQKILKPKYESLGFKYLNHIFIPGGQKVDVASTWGGRLTRRSGRPTLEIHFEAV